MLIIQDKLVSDALIQEHFLCDLQACKGACCWEGDFGAPLEMEEIQTLKKIYPKIKPFLTEDGKKAIEEKGIVVYYKGNESDGTPLLSDGACAFMTYDELGIARCGIELAYKAGQTDFIKPISCHLYPIRINKNEEVNFEALNYDQWDICAAACDSGRKAQLPLYKFVRVAIIRKYGQAFYDELEAVARYLQEEDVP